MWRPLAYLPQELTELLVDLLVTLRQPVPVHHSALPHVGQGGELVQVTALGLQLGEHLVQAVHLDDLLAQPAKVFLPYQFLHKFFDELTSSSFETADIFSASRKTPPAGDASQSSCARRRRNSLKSRHFPEHAPGK